MVRRIEDFVASWDAETAATLKLLDACTPASLAHVVAPGGRSLGRLAWHITLTLPEMMGHAGLNLAGPELDETVPPLARITATYAAAAHAVREAVSAQWTDGMLDDEVPMYGERWRRGDVLSALIVHQAHHRGQMTVLMRQAGLVVPGLYGPAAEEWAAIGMPAPA